MSGRHGRDGVTLTTDFLGTTCLLLGRVGCDVVAGCCIDLHTRRQFSLGELLTCSSTTVIP